jgi:hypothetical protein
VNTSHDAPADLTSTIHLSQLRAVPEIENFQRVIEKLSPEEKSIISELSPEKAMLIGVTGPAKGFRFLINTAATKIGREDASDIPLDDVTVSRKHAEIQSRNGVHTLIDSKSLNGTYVNAISVNTAVLKNGDEIQIGKFRLIFFTGKAHA